MIATYPRALRNAKSFENFDLQFLKLRSSEAPMNMDVTC
jgi:hypothetical protein